jgi:PAS domain S-box-containing protein
MRKDQPITENTPDESGDRQVTPHGIKDLNELLTLAKEELRITNEELNAYKNRLDELVSIHTKELLRKEESLRYKSVLEKLITGISNRFFNIASELVDQNIIQSFQEICGFFDADAAFLMEILPAEQKYRITHSWNNHKISWNKEFFYIAPLSDLFYEEKIFQEHDYFMLQTPDDLPENSYIRSSFEASGTRSMLIVPILFQGNIVGFTGFSTVKAGRIWNPDEISLIHVIGENFLTALRRQSFEKTLIESERNYREIFNTTNEAIIIFEPADLRILDVNEAAVRLFGFTNQELLKARLEILLSTDAGYPQELALQYVQEAIQQGSVIFEWNTRRKSGELFWIEISLKSTLIGGVMKIIAVVRDISERKKTQELLMQSEERFRSIIQYLSDIIWIIDEHATITYESPSSWQVLGYPPGYLIGKNGFSIIHEEDIALVLKDLNEVYQKQNDFIPTEFRARHAKGNWISLEVIANNMLEHPAIKGIIVTGRDVTERNRVEKALRVSESKFRNIFNNSSDAIVIVSSNFSILEVNEVFLDITGYTLAETRQMKLTGIISDAYLPQLVEKMMKIFQNEYQPAVECEIIGKSKKTFPAEINSKLIDFEGEQALISVIRNITERLLLENRILDTIISTEEQEREKFARNLHDDLGPLLSSIKMYVNSLASSTEQQKNEFIITQLKKILTEVIQSTKELSNDLSPHVLSTYGLLAALEWFINQVKPHIFIHLECNLKDERLPSSVELSLYRIVKELINNTLKHSRATAIHIKLHRILKKIHLIYSDNGIGFKENWQNNLATMGMGMSNIISRSRLIRATSKFFNNAPHGMSFEMEVPME